MSGTHTFVVMELPKPMFDEIERQMRGAGYDHAFIGDTIDMHGIGVKAADPEPVGQKMVTPEGRAIYAKDRSQVIEAIEGLTDEAFGQLAVALMPSEVRGYFTFSEISEEAKASIRALGSAASRFVAKG